MSKDKSPSEHQGLELSPQTADQNRRGFIKQVVVGAGSVTFVRMAEPALAENAEAIPPVVSLLLDESGNQRTLRPVRGDNQDQTITIPENAVAMRIEVNGASGSGSGTNFVRDFPNEIIAGANGGAGGNAVGFFTLDEITTLTAQVGEGGKAPSADGPGAAGEFGGGQGGQSFGFSEPNEVARGFGGSGGGYSAVIANDDRLLISAGGGGGAGGSGASSNGSGGRGGLASSFSEPGINAGMDGSSNGGPTAVGEGGGDPSFSQRGINASLGASNEVGTAGEGSENGGFGAGAGEGSLAGAGGGGGGGLTAEDSLGQGIFVIGGGGGGAGGANPSETPSESFHGGGGGGAGARNFLASEFNFISGSANGESTILGGGGGTLDREDFGESGADGSVSITFLDQIPG